MKLLCSEDSRRILEHTLVSFRIPIEEESNLAIVEEGYDDGALYHLKIQFASNEMESLFEFLLSMQTSGMKVNRVIGLKDGSYKPLSVEEIYFFNAINNDVYANLSNGDSYLVKNKLYQLEELLDASVFFRINKSEIINMKKISIIKPMFKGKLILYLEGYKQPLDISRNYTKEFKERLGF